jgi:hypothetical protein
MLKPAKNQASITKLYIRAGLPAPKGKGEHTIVFHKRVVAIAKSYTGNGSSPKDALSKAYPTAMKQLGANKAVQKSHRSKYRRSK